MKDEYAIRVRDLHKSFKIYSDRGKKLKEFLLFSKRRSFERRQVLKGISFDVKKGEAIGLVGHNGCGKSTTLKMLTRIMYPDSGTIEINGRVSSLIELGAGFHPDMSGRENIYINASIFGLNKREIDRRIDRIIAFSELEDFIDNPVRTYSSGMYMRLAFSVAINVDADILLIDEILAVGDAGFQAKCFNRLRDIKAKGVTIVIVSHSLGQIEQICERSYWIHDGIVAAQGPPREVHPMYLDYIAGERIEIADRERQFLADRTVESLSEKQRETEAQKGGVSQGTDRELSEELSGDPESGGPDNITEDGISDNSTVKGNAPEDMLPATYEDALKQGKRRWGNGKARITKVSMIRRLSKKEGYTFKTGEDVDICLDYEAHDTVEDADIGIAIYRSDGTHCYGTNTRVERFNTYDLTGRGTITIGLDSLPLLNGTYSLDLAIEEANGIAVDFWCDICTFEVFTTMSGEVGLLRLPHSWDIT